MPLNFESNFYFIPANYRKICNVRKKLKKIQICTNNIEIPKSVETIVKFYFTSAKRYSSINMLLECSTSTPKSCLWTITLTTN